MSHARAAVRLDGGTMELEKPGRGAATEGFLAAAALLFTGELVVDPVSKAIRCRQFTASSIPTS
jgi:hypothetical protein